MNGKIQFDELSSRVIGCALEVHRGLGPGLLESTYERCLAYELQTSGIPFELQKSMPVVYKGVQLDCGYRVDLLVDGELIVELKAATVIDPIHEAQILTYLKLAQVKTGLLINFNVPRLKEGIRRFVR
jgi:GxxExxY protein